MFFTEAKIRTTCETLQKYIYSKPIDLNGFEYIESDYKHEKNTPPKGQRKLFCEGDRLKGTDKHYWFTGRFKTPAAIDGKNILFKLVTGREGSWDATNPQCIVYLNGKAVQGMDTNHTAVPLEFDREYNISIYLYSGMADGYFEFIPQLITEDEKIKHLYYDLSVPYNTALCYEKSNPDYIAIMKQLELTANIIDFKKPLSKDFYASVDKATEYIYDNFYKSPLCGKTDAVVNCIGHTHIDIAWLWTVEQTKEKAQRSFSTVVNMMKQYPEYKFMSSQAVLYKYVKMYLPEIYAEIKELVKQGRWEVEGAMYVEADCNLTSGESLVRQIMFGKKFFREEFGVDSKVLWLPDVFGYSAALPQILKKCGVDKFVTSKISWNEFNKLPYDTFMWEGIDGTEIFTDFLTARDFNKHEENDVYTTYNGYIRPSQVLGTWNRYQQKEYANETIITFGFGDGGGGPTTDMLEQQRRLSFGMPGLPKTRIEKAGEYLDKLYSDFTENGKKLHRLPKWVGELYLELHRGTYTSIAKNKRNNRKSELLYQKLEALCITDSIANNKSYPQQEINSAWETILLNQFHDIIPGSSIKEVYDNTDIEYAKILSEGENLAESKLKSIAESINTSGGTLVYNPLSFNADGYITVNGKTAGVKDIPSFGWKVVTEFDADCKVTAKDNIIENKYYKLTFDKNGNISSLYDKEYDREVIKPNCAGNELQVFEDFPKQHDAWEITNYYKSKMQVINDVSEMAPVFDGARGGYRIKRRFLDSEIVQNIYMYNDSRRIDFETVIDWKEKHMLLKTAFPFNVHSNKAAYDIQFGNIERATHSNTSWDAAKFEVCAHKWADISEDGYGVSILNDCKYGHSADGSTLKLTLLKCAEYPNPAADKEIHRFTYSVYPHAGNFKEGKTVQEAYKLNVPFMSAEIGANAGNLPERFSAVSCGSENIIIETMKKAENTGDIILRLYEAYNRRGNVKIKLGFDIQKAYVCDMPENAVSEIDVHDNTISLPVKNYEIVTLKLVPEKNILSD